MDIKALSQGKNRVSNVESIAATEATRSVNSGRDFAKAALGVAALSVVLKNKASIAHYTKNPVVVAAQYTAILDKVTCPLCEYLDGSVVSIVDPIYQTYQPPIHGNCRCMWFMLTSADPGIAGLVLDFKEPNIGLVAHHGNILSERVGVPHIGRNITQAKEELAAFSKASKYNLPKGFSNISDLQVAREWDRLRKVYVGFPIGVRSRYTKDLLSTTVLKPSRIRNSLLGKSTDSLRVMAQSAGIPDTVYMSKLEIATCLSDATKIAAIVAIAAIRKNKKEK